MTSRFIEERLERAKANPQPPLRALDLFCGAGGATKGLQRAGFHVTGVDIKPQPNYCGDQFVQCDAMQYLARLDYMHDTFDFFWASPPCQAYSNAQKIRNYKHPALIDDVRDILTFNLDANYCIENVPGAPLINPVMLCGTMFGLKTYRHRLFECSFPVAQPDHPRHTARSAKMGRPPKEDEFIQVVGNFSGAQKAREAMGIDWMNLDELREAIPPAYSEFIARAFLAQRETRAA